MCEHYNHNKRNKLNKKINKILTQLLCGSGANFNTHATIEIEHREHGQEKRK